MPGYGIIPVNVKTMSKRKDLKQAAQALKFKPKVNYTWEFPWGLIDELSDITRESEYPVGMEEVESVLIALTKLKL